MRIRIILCLLIATFIAQPTIVAQEAFQPSQPASQHEFLQKFVGQWDLTSSGAVEGGQTMNSKAIMTASMLGKFWVVNSSEHELPGFKMKSIQMIGFDTNKQKYVGIWADSVINHMWHYEGTVDKSGKKLLLYANGPSMKGDGKTAEFLDAYEFTDDDTFIATSSMKAEDGTWKVIMKGSGKRRKSK